jgi:hypothetical protein
VGEHEEVEGNVLVCPVGAGVAGVGLPALSRSSGEMWAMGGGGPAREGGVGSRGVPAGRVACASWQGRDTGCGKSPAASPVGGCRSPLGVAPWRGLPGQASSARWPVATVPQQDRIGEGRAKGWYSN